MKIYTKTGDQGKTSLFSGERVAKHDARVEVYGEIDELNSFVGCITAFLPSKKDPITSEIENVQKALFVIGARLATTPDSERNCRLIPLTSADIKTLEQAIDRMESSLPPLHSFILPGGSQAAAAAHVARTVCRRAERRLTRLIQDESSGDSQTDEQMAMVRQYLNRLSDYLFVLARYCNLLSGISDTAYLPGDHTSTEHDS